MGQSFRAARVTYLCSLTLALMLILLVGGQMTYAYLFLILSLPIFALLYLLAASASVAVYQYVSSPAVMKGEEVTYTFAARNRGVLPLGHLGATVEDSRHLTPQGRDMVFSLLPFAKRAYSIPLRFDYRGLYRVGVGAIHVADPFALFRRKLGVTKLPQVAVYPRIYDIARFAPSRLSLLQEQSVFMKESEEQASDTRRYVHGDPLNRLHRNLTARSGEPITRLFEREREGRVLLVADFTPFEAENTALCEDAVIELCLSAARYIMNLGRKAEICYACGGGEVWTGELTQARFTKVLWDMAGMSFDAHIPPDVLFSKSDALYTVVFSAHEPSSRALDAAASRLPLDYVCVRRFSRAGRINYDNSGRLRVFEPQAHDSPAATLESMP
ncbi:MAG: DUF58 domain-containing protein [Oscillospiraceae bacterium]|jgi:uncharacterized protein (DUF58 family)|nr:DUF58 domain-containing protein [Oscillospiraceae bacterium]